MHAMRGQICHMRVTVNWQNKYNAYE